MTKSLEHWSSEMSERRQFMLPRRMLKGHFVEQSRGIIMLDVKPTLQFGIHF